MTQSDYDKVPLCKVQHFILGEGELTG